MSNIVEERRETEVEVLEFGPVSELTKGVSTFFPYSELGVPPFIYWCPRC